MQAKLCVTGKMNLPIKPPLTHQTMCTNTMENTAESETNTMALIAA